MARLAWFTPLPPVRSGIAAYNAELLPRLSGRHSIDVFTGEKTSWEPASAAPALEVCGAHDFLWKNDRHPYDLVVYQLGNAACHDFMWPHLPRYPGLVVLHDGQLHHERSRALLSRGRYDEYRREFRYNHPDAPEDLAELVIATWAGNFYYMFPMLRWVVRTARLVAVHSDGLAGQLRTAYPGVEVRRVPHGMEDPVSDAARSAARRIRSRHGIPDGPVLFAAFGLVTPEKRIAAALRALRRLAAEGIDAYLLLAGGTPAYYDAAAEARALGIEGRVRITGYVADEELPAYVLAADACLSLRWPTSHETSGTWIRAAAAGRPTLITDLAHTGDIPSLDPRTWEPTAATSETPVAITIDLLDEDESLRLAMTRLATDAGLRRALGDAARSHWRRHHAMEHAVEGYEAAIARAIASPAPHVRDLPPHLLDEGLGLARELTSALGVDVDFLRPRRLDLPGTGG